MYEVTDHVRVTDCAGDGSCAGDEHCAYLATLTLNPPLFLTEEKVR